MKAAMQKYWGLFLFMIYAGLWVLYIYFWNYSSMSSGITAIWGGLMVLLTLIGWATLMVWMEGT